MITSPRWRPPAFSVPHPVTGTGTTCLSRHRTMGPRILPSTPPGSGDRIMSVPRLRQSMSYSLWFSISAFILDLSSCPAPFRAWGQGTGDAGGYNAPGLPNVVGEWSNFNVPIISVPAPLPSGAIRLSNSANVNSTLTIGGSGYVWDGMALEASRSNFIYGGSDTVMPASVNLPVILYLGIPA